MPTEIEWVRLATFIDGEGCIDIHTRRQFNKKFGRHYETRYVRIQLPNCDPRLPLWCKNVFGGSIQPKRSNRTNPKWRPATSWEIASQKAITVILGCLPYFLLKREQAEIALAFQETVKRIGRGGHSEATLQRRMELQEQMKVLKHQIIDSETVLH
jgi:hypothetical protein